MQDLISRQAAIDAVISLCDDCNTCYCGSCRINDPVDKDAKKVLEELPSAQPEPCDDAVSRKAAIDAALSAFSRGLIASPDIRKLPSVQPEPHWIPVSERLPEASGRYLVTRGLNACGAIWNRVYIINYSDLMGLKSERIWWDGNVGKSAFERIDDVIAWQPLPDPYMPEPYRAERRTDE